MWHLQNLKLALQTMMLVFLLAGAAIAQEIVRIGNVPLPSDAIEAREGPSGFAGTWVGQWDGWRNHILIIERVSENGLSDVVYAVGSDLNGPGRWFRRKAKIQDDTLTFVDDGFPASYQLSKTGRVRGVFDDYRGFAVLERRNLSDILASPGKDWFSIGHREYLYTDLVENGQPIRLTVVTYAPKGVGPFPLALIHHGSTGSGTRPSDFDRVWTSAWLADLLNEHGWLVAFPYRRGRGMSDGLYDEGFAPNRADGYSPEAAVSLPGAERALTDANAALAVLRLRPEVEQSKILVGGVSRGGVVAIMQAGSRPDEVVGVINFVGGWTGKKGDASINPTLFKRISPFKGEVLSIYGEEDPYYSIEHSKSNLAEMEKQGAGSTLHVLKLPGYGNGHRVITMPSFWEKEVEQFLRRIDRPE
ncbi:dienelactone hydrolase family protein [uncultured Roseobacter sp.]|uniref:dienelactone hydrolase family protein n=1 Tax=uncultured Roseobacter sp. TaxID=114847 RepID=UPI0026046F62|nr:dienelactone hydrolase family protein [uncultured Roseobacter sp.]